jgi:hypothetical protein
VTTYARAADVLERTSLDRLLLLPVAAAAPMLLDAPGRLVWEVLSEPTTLDELSEILAAATNTPVGTVRSDVAPLLAELRAQGALVELA